MRDIQEIRKEIKTLQTEKRLAKERINSAEKLINTIDNQLETLRWITEEETE